MEASIVEQPAAVAAIGVRAPFLRLQSDERLVALVRRGDQAAFEALVQRYRSRLLAFCRHMLRSREDAEDVLQEVFAAAYRAMRADQRELHVRPWLYRIARNMSLKHIARRRPAADGSLEELELASSVTTHGAAHARERFRQVVADVQELPETQRTALLMREMEGLSYDQIAGAMDTTVPGVKSLLVRARVSLAEAAQGRLLGCEAVRLELRDAAEGAAPSSAPARRHARSCSDCRAYRQRLGGGWRRAAACVVAPLELAREILSKLGAGAAASGGSAAGGASLAGGGSAGGAVSAAVGGAASKAAAVIATATLVTAGAAQVEHAPRHHRAQSGPLAQPVAAPARPAAAVRRQLSRPAPAPTRAPHLPAVPRPEAVVPEVQGPPALTGDPAPGPAVSEAPSGGAPQGGGPAQDGAPDPVGRPAESPEPVTTSDYPSQQPPTSGPPGGGSAAVAGG